jgi:hypothetical protein
MAWEPGRDFCRIRRLQPQGQEPPARVGRADVRASIADVNGSLLLGEIFPEQVQILVSGQHDL